MQQTIEQKTQTVTCANCGCKKVTPNEGDYLPDGRWFHCWNCRKELVGPGKLFTAKITSWKKIQKFFEDLNLDEQTVLISVMRNTWRFLPKDAQVIKMENLGPPVPLFKETRKFFKSGDIEDRDKEIPFNIHYSVHYMEHLTNGKTIQQLEYIKRLLDNEKNIVLMCICDPNAFCHRLHLKEYIAMKYGMENRIARELVF